MIKFNEIKIGNQSTFIKTIISNNGEIVGERKVVFPLQYIEKDNFTYFLLYDDKMNVIHEVFDYLNYDIGKNPLTTRKNSAHALRFLYCYCSLANCDIRKINEETYTGLLSFLEGIYSSVNNYEIRTIRSANTVKGYLSIYRAFFKAKGIKCKPLFKSHMINTYSYLGDEAYNVQRTVYDNDPKKKKSEKYEIPKYISPDEFRHIYSLALNANDMTSQLVMHLMYGYGLRLGEVLGITTEDILEKKENGRLIPVIRLRNRLSDQKFQFAKNLMHVSSTEQYKKNSDYKNSYSDIHITYDLYESLIEYINSFHEQMMHKYPQNYEKGRADIVSYRNAPETNHYVFLNDYGKILSDQTFNNHLKNYYKLAGIQLDYRVRKDNLGHRLRHGFAMFHAYYSENKKNILQLKKLMRHNSIQSTSIYYNPTEEDLLNIQTEFQDELYLMIPELKGDIND